MRENVYRGMSGGLVLLANLVTVALLGGGGALAAAFPRRVLRAASVLGAVPVAMAVALCVYVFGEDDYRDNGISRWDAYTSPGGELDELFIVSVAGLAASAVLMAIAGLRGRSRLFLAAAVGGAVTSLLLVTATIVGFTVN
jgi:hypothetical protein